MNQSRLQSLRAWIVQRLQHTRFAQLVLGTAYLLIAELPLFNNGRRRRYLARASERLAYLGWQDRLARRFEQLVTQSGSDFDPNQINWGRYGGWVAKRDQLPLLTLPTSLLLKPPGADGELGVLYVTFEYNWVKLLNHKQSKQLFMKYLIVGASSWSPTDFGVLQAFAGYASHPAFIGISNVSDVAAYRAAGSGVIASPLMASDWVDPDQYRPLSPSKRDIDILMVAHWSQFKRHDLFFTILSKMPSHLRVVLVGRDAEGRTADSMRNMARRMGCTQELEIHTRIPNKEVSDLQCRAKVAIITSLREGSCVAVTEAFAANTPVAMLRGAHVGSAAYINERTGVFLDLPIAHQQLISMINDFDRFDPRQWLIENACAEMSSERLNAQLKHYCVSRNLPWTRDIAPLRWVYVPGYARDDDRIAMKPALDELRAKFDIELIEYQSSAGLVG